MCHFYRGREAAARRQTSSLWCQGSTTIHPTTETCTVTSTPRGGTEAERGRGRPTQATGGAEEQTEAVSRVLLRSQQAWEGRAGREARVPSRRRDVCTPHEHSWATAASSIPWAPRENGSKSHFILLGKNDLVLTPFWPDKWSYMLRFYLLHGPSFCYFYSQWISAKHYYFKNLNTWTLRQGSLFCSHWT